MHFLPDVYVPCEVSHGRRFNEATLAVRYNHLSVADVLDLTVDEALVLFKNHPAIRRSLDTLADVGLGYIALGQSSPTLSGGEAQRVKLSLELSKRDTGRTLYILDEPTTGLHFDDIKKLLRVLDRLVEGGNTVVVIEHNLDSDQDRRLGDRHGPGRRRRRRPHRRRRHARAGGCRRRELHGAIPSKAPGHDNSPPRSAIAPGLGGGGFGRPRCGVVGTMRMGRGSDSAGESRRTLFAYISWFSRIAAGRCLEAGARLLLQWTEPEWRDEIPVTGRLEAAWGRTRGRVSASLGRCVS